MTLKQKMLDIRKRRSALLAANFYNLETLNGILSAAAELGKPIILQLSPSSIKYIGLNTAVNMARGAMQEFGVEVWLHLDHAASVSLIREALVAGFDSVMIDASEKSFDENVRITRGIVEMAEKYQVCVEAELGYVPKLGESHAKQNFTDPSEAKQFAAETGIDLLAIAIGSVHGFYQGDPHIDLIRLAEINAATLVPMVLHGGSGIPDKIIREAVIRGICKINIATETKNIFVKSLREELMRTTEIDIRTDISTGNRSSPIADQI